MIKLLEDEVYLKIRKEDINLFESILKDCEKEYTEIMKKETNEEYKTKLIIIKDEHLTKEEGGEIGGVILYNQNRKIVCINSIQSRLNLCFEEMLPQIRSLLFPKG